MEILDTVCTKTKLINSSNNKEDILRKLNIKKDTYLKNKEFKKAIKVNVDMEKLISKKVTYKVSDETIKNLFGSNIHEKVFGFKYN